MTCSTRLHVWKNPKNELNPFPSCVEETLNPFPDLGIQSYLFDRSVGARVGSSRTELMRELATTGSLKPGRYDDQYLRPTRLGDPGRRLPRGGGFHRGRPWTHEDRLACAVDPV